MAHPGSPSATTSLALLDRARTGDADALAALLAQYLPRLSRWARGRLPTWARDLGDTEDLVQDAVLRTIRHVPELDLPDDGALQAYLRQAVLNRIRDEVRRAARRPVPETLDSGVQDPGTSPLEGAIGTQSMERYEQALQRLRADERDAIIARVEMRMPYDELARATGKPSPNAARMFVARALVRLGEEMRRAR
jgi:RNA polymerase sigma factor (sigma-70 family)